MPMSNKGVADRIRVMGPNGEPKKIKERPLKEITNKLETRPINLKPCQTGLRQASEKSNKGGESR